MGEAPCGTCKGTHLLVNLSAARDPRPGRRVGLRRFLGIAPLLKRAPRLAAAMLTTRPTGQSKMDNENNWGVGDCADAKAFDTAIVNGRSVDLIHGEHPHSRSDNTTYARFKGRGSGGTISNPSRSISPSLR